MPRITNIQARKGTATDWSTQNPVLASGELGYDLTNRVLKLGDGDTTWNNLSSINLSSSNITDFNSAISGVLPVKNISAGDNIIINSVSGVYTISSTGGGTSSSNTGVRGVVNATGTLSSFNVAGGYTTGYLDLFQNGSKLLSGSDFTATDGTSIILTNSVPSGTVLEYVSLGASLTSTNYTKLDSISSSFNGSSTSFGLAVSGTSYYPVNANTLGIYVGGVPQEPISSYSVSGSNIIFTEAPASGLTFWGVGYGTTAVATLNGIAPGSVSSPAISSSNDLNTGFYFPSSGNISVAGNLGIGTSSPSASLDINNNKFRVRNSKTPASSTDTGNTGDICWDSSYIYVCTSTNSWARTLISAWSSDPYFSYVSLLLHMNGTGSSFIDSSVSPKTITSYGNVTQSVIHSKWGEKSAYFDGSGDYLMVPDSVGFSLSGDFVIEFWVRFSASPGYYAGAYGAAIINRYQGVDMGNNGWQVRINGNSSDYTTINVYTGNTDLNWSYAFNQNQWYYVAVSRDSNNIRVYVDGSQIGSTISNSDTFNGSGHALSIGRLALEGTYLFDLNGYIDDLRITVGSSRAYTGSTITVPTAAFPDYNT